MTTDMFSKVKLGNTFLLGSILFVVSCGGKEGGNNEATVGTQPICIDVNTVTLDSLKSMPLKIQKKFNLDPQLVEDTNSLWDTGTVIKIYFIDGDSTGQKNILRIANHWSKFANIQFEKIKKKRSADVRVSFLWSGYWSYNRVNALFRPLTEPTMSLQGLDKNPDTLEVYRVTLHEFGHLLGFVHEHQSPKSPIQWNKMKVYEYFKQPPNNWDPLMVNSQILNKYQGSQFNASSYDSLSIMHYYIPKSFTLNNYSSPWNNQLSQFDQQLVAKSYPK